MMPRNLYFLFLFSHIPDRKYATWLDNSDRADSKINRGSALSSLAAKIMKASS